MDTFSLRGIKYALSKQEVLKRLQFNKSAYCLP